ncbi:MAG: protein kinase [Holophagales bacterium]|nr:protein kinase [Holophagales bacterium]
MRLSPGLKVGPYEVRERRGEGATGEVWLARDGRLGRDVALKVLRPGAGAGFASDLLREARAASALTHPAIATIYEAGEAEVDGLAVAYIAMELVDGPTLGEHARAGASPGELVALVEQVAEGLAAAHARGVVHRDVKPSNILVAEGRARLVDFGLATRSGALGQDSLETLGLEEAARESVGIAGTAAYMSPEQIRGEELDGRSDVFAVGAVLYELLAGRRAFPGETVGAVLSAVLGRDPEPLSTLNPAVPEALSRVVSRMLEKERTRRTPSMRDAVDDLAAARRGQLPAGIRGASGASVAVVAFRNISARPEDEWLGTGLAETLAAELRSAAGPTVVASERVHEMVRRLADERGGEGGEIAEEAGRRLGVRWVATGGFQRVGDRLRITARLSDAGTGEVVKSLKADGEVAGLFDLQDRLAADLVLAYREASGSAAAFAPAAEETRVVAAYEAYAKGLINLRVGSVTSLDRAALFLERATLLDPRYVAAQVSLGWALQDKAEYLGLVEPAEKALAAFGRALELRPSSAEACRGLAYTLLFLRRDDEALAAARKALSLAPGEAAAHQAYARVLFVAKGEFLEAARAYEAALALNPQGGWIALQLAHCLALSGELPRADAVARRAIELQEQALSGKEGLLIVGAHVRLAHVHALEGRFEEAVSELLAERRHLASVDHALSGRALVELHVRLGSALARLGRKDEAEEALERALSRFEERLAQGSDDPFTRYYAAQALVLRGETVRALELLAGAAALRPALTLRRVLLEPDFAPLYSEPGFQQLLAGHRIAAPADRTGSGGGAG